MKKLSRLSGLSLTILALTTTGCMTRKELVRDQVVVSETYTHRYGVEITPDDWSSRGESGKVTSNLANGVVVSKTYDAGVLEGDTTYTFPHQSAIEKVEVYSQNTLTQETVNYPSGNPQKQIQHRSPTNQVVYTWYENGTPLSIEEYEDGWLVSGEYHNPDHQVEGTVENRQGTRVNRDHYGIVLSVETIENGQVAMQTLYHPNQAPKSLTPYVNGKVDGIQKTFLPGGEPNTIETWVAGIQEGETTIFLNGEKYAVIPYHLGRKDGVEKRFKDGADVVQEIYWVSDMRHGPSHSYVDGTVATDWYYEGSPVSKIKYDALMSHQQ